MPIPILVATNNGTVTSANGPALELLGPPRSRSCRLVVNAMDDEGHSICSQCLHDPLPAGGQREHGVVNVGGEKMEMVCSSLGNSRIITLLAEEAPPEGPHLTPREKEVLVLVARGLTTARIAERLGLSYPTVRTHLEHIREKLSVATRAQAVARALALKLIE